MITKKSIAIAIATGSLVLNAFATTAFADTVTVTGNGADSNNSVTSTNNNSTTVNQSNNALITNNVSSNADTGDNSANRNTGGSVKVDTGAATTNTQVSTAANLNQANAGCGCNDGANTVTVSGNGDGSHNSVGDTNSAENSTQVFQNNHAGVTNKVDSSANTGYNTASANTGVNGTGDVTVTTSNATNTVGVSTMANANLANIGSGSSAGAGTGESAVITGNGAGTHNNINLDNSDSTLVEQGNSAYVYNGVDGNSSTGGNDANRNTGANVTVDTGSSTTQVGVDNMVNFNSASLDCGCFTGGDLLKLAGNGADSHNTITDSAGGSFKVFQGTEGTGNSAILGNNVSGNSASGSNGSNANTGAVVGIDPTSVMTGDSSSTTGVSNEGNVNVYGSTPLTLPGNLQFTFDWSSLFGMFGG